MSSVKDYALYVYAGIVVVSFGIGALSSINPYLKWLSQRKYKKLKFKSAETVVNIGVDVGKFVFDTTTSGVFSALIGGTAPISVPLMLFFREDDIDEKKQS